MRWIVAVWFVVFCCLAAFGQKTVPKGIRSGDTYTNDGLGFSYQLPPGYNRPVICACLVTPTEETFLVAGGPGSNSIRVDADSDMPAQSYAETMAQGVLPGYKVTLQPTHFRFSGKDFVRTDANWTEDGRMVYMALLSTDRRGFRIDWRFSAASPEDRGRLVLTLNNITFHDENREKQGH